MWNLNIPRILRCYWGGKKLSYLRYLTLKSFQHYNPDWEIILYKPKILQSVFYWRSEEQLYDDNYVDCTNRLKDLNITIIEVDFNAIGFDNNASEVHKSDYLRWKVLYEEGGVWADMDILFIKPMEQLFFNKPDFSGTDTVVCINKGHSIGFLMSSKGNRYFQVLHQASRKEYRKDGYQSMGALLCEKLFPMVESIFKEGLTPYNLPMDIVYSYDSTHINEAFDSRRLNKITHNTIGIHWYGGSKAAGEYLNDTNGGLYSERNSIIDGYINILRPKTVVKDKNYKISIVMAFYNRQELLDKTLESLDKSSVKDYELIIVDDASAVPLRCDRAKVIRVEKKDKWYNCSAVAWNRGLREATGDIVILNSPECYHVGDIMAYARDNIRPNLYLSFGCYSINKVETQNFHKGIFPILVDAYVDGHTGWYNHTKHRPAAYHFCSAILKKDLDIIGGFDERYAYGVAFDDDEFIRTIKHMGMDIKIINNPYVIHQFHTHFEFESPSAWREPHALNESIYNLGYNPRIHRDYGRNKELFDPNTFKQSVKNKALIEAKKKELLRKENPLVLENFLRKLGGI